MKASIASFGGAGYDKFMQAEDRGVRQNLWNSLLIDDKNGRVVNNTSGTLHYTDHQRMLDDVIMTRQYFPTVYNTLSAVPGIVVPVSIGDTLIGSTNMNEFNAKTSMNGSDRVSNQSDYQFEWTPQPIFHCDWGIPWRQGGFSYKQTDGATESGIQVALERDRTMVLGNEGIVVNVNGVNAPLYGLTNHPATLSLPGGISDWADTANSNAVHGEAISVLAQMFSDKRAAQVQNSVIIFTANDVYPQLEQDYATAKGDRTNIERLKAITSVKDVLPCQWLPDGAVLFVEAMPMTLRIPSSTDITVVPHTQVDPMEKRKFTTYSAATIQVRQDRNGRTGVAYATKA